MPSWFTARRVHQVLFPLTLGFLFFAWTRLASFLRHEILFSDALPQWDMAKYGLEGVRLAAAFSAGDPWLFLRHLFNLSVWPPFFPLLEAPALLLFGYPYEVPRLFVLGLHLALLGAALWAARGLDRQDGDAIGLLVAAGLLASPLYQVFAALVMLEVPGTLLLLLCLGAYWRAIPTPGGAVADKLTVWQLTCGLSTALFFCKYNYGLMWLLALALAEARRRTGSFAHLLLLAQDRVAQDRVRRIPWQNPWTWFLSGYSAFLLLILVTGGGRITVGDFTLRVTSIGNPIYALLLLVLLRAALSPRRTRTRVQEFWHGLARWDRQWVGFVVLPIASWMLWPPHLKDFFGFVQNRSSGIGFFSREFWLAYPHTLANQYAPHPAWGWVLGLAGIGLALRWKTLDDQRRALLLALGVSTALVLLHPYRLPRFLFTVVPLFWLTLAVWISDGLRAASRRLPRLSTDRTRLGVLLLSGLFLSWTVRLGINAPRLERELAAYSVPATARPVVEQIAAWMAAGGPPALRGATQILGVWNLLSPTLIEWHLYLRYPELIAQASAPISRFWVTPPSSPLPGSSTPEAVLQDPAVCELIVIQLLPAAALTYPAFAEENAGLMPWIQALAADRRWGLTADLQLAAAGYQLQLYRALSCGGRSTPPPASE